VVDEWRVDKLQRIMLGSPFFTILRVLFVARIQPIEFSAVREGVS
jgi:hypothetical protein